MANESIVTGKKYRILVDAAQKLWQRVSFWTKSTDVEFNDGKTAETKVGSINGITSSLTSSDGSIALSAAAGRTLNSNLTTVTNSVNSGLNGCKITYESGAFYAAYGSTKKKLGRIDGSQIVYPSLTKTEHDSRRYTLQMTIPASVQEAYILSIAHSNGGVALSVSVSKGSATLLKSAPSASEQNGPITAIYYFQNTTGSASVCTSTATGVWPTCSSMYISL